MKEKKWSSVFETGVWIKEQNGVLTMGKIGDDELQIELGNELAETISSLEDQVEEALYGNDSMKFDPEKVDFNTVLNKINESFKDTDLVFTGHCAQGSVLKSDYNDIYSLIYGLAENSMLHTGEEKKPAVYISASVVEGKLYIVYRDSGPCRNMNNIAREAELVKDSLHGEIKLNDSGRYPYLDIMIPEKSYE